MPSHDVAFVRSRHGPHLRSVLASKNVPYSSALQKQSVEGDKQTARVHRESSMITHPDTPAARVLRTKQASETAAAFDDMYRNQSVSSVRTDNGGEFQGEFAAKLKER